MKPWTVAALVVAAILYGVALSNSIYELTSPPALEWHVILRKFYSIVAFTLVGYLFRRSLVEWGRSDVVLPTILGVALYSAAIEVGQALMGSKEGLGWNAFDTFCGALGGTLAVADRLLVRRQPVRARPRR